MKITNIRLQVLDTNAPRRIFELVAMPGQERERWMHAPGHRLTTPPSARTRGASENEHEFLLHVDTDEGVTGTCTAVAFGTSRFVPGDLEQLRAIAVGMNPLDREMIWQKFHQGTRWVYREPGWFGALDNCLWDIAGKVAGLPVSVLLGRVRESASCYYNVRGATIEEACEDAERALSQGFEAVKDHYYHPYRENIRWLTKTRETVGPNIDLMHDCVGIYTFDEAVKVGRVLEELDYLWFEEPLPERLQNRLQELCATLDIPVLATEMFMYDVDMQAQWLISGATDLIRVNARHGTTSAMKLAHLAELHGTNVELNGVGGLWGIVHAHLLCAIQNTTRYEFFPGGFSDASGREIGLENPVIPEKGRIRAPEGPGWGAIWDDRQLRRRTVAEY